MTTFIIRRLLVALFFAIPAFALACSCTPPPPNLKTPLAHAEWSLARSAVLFEGTVDHIEVKGWPIKVLPGKTVPTMIGISVTFTGVRVYRGVISQKVVVETGVGGGDCGYPFETGRSYLVDAWVNESGQLSNGICGATSPLEFSGTELRMLRGEPPSSWDLKDLSSNSEALNSEGPPAGVKPLKQLCGKVLIPKGARIKSLKVFLWRAGEDALPFPLDDTETGADGSFCFIGLDRGEYLVGALDVSEQHRGFCYIGYYPGTAQRSDAKPIAFSTSKANLKIEFPLVRQSLYTVRGRVRGPGLAGLQVMLMNTNLDAFSALNPMKPGPDGTFQFEGVPPGHYSAFAFIEADEAITFLSPAVDIEVTENRQGVNLDLIQKTEK